LDELPRFIVRAQFGARRFRKAFSHDDGTFPSGSKRLEEIEVGGLDNHGADVGEVGDVLQLLQVACAVLATPWQGNRCEVSPGPETGHEAGDHLN